MIQCVRFAENFPLKAILSQNFNRKITRFVVSNEKRSVNMLVGSDALAKCFSDRTSYIACIIIISKCENHSVIVESEKITEAGRSVVI